MFRINFVCPGVAEYLDTRASDIQRHFELIERPHLQNVRCDFNDGDLTLVADDFDEKSLALQVEFSQTCISSFLLRKHLPLSDQ